MKNLVFTGCTLLLLLPFFQAFSQVTPPRGKARCGSMEVLRNYLQANPQMPQYPVTTGAAGRTTANNNATATQRTAATELTIPVVIHLVLPPEDQARVTEADVRWQIGRLNEDFSGLNPDSSNATAFYSSRGHSAIRFCLAQRDPAGNPTNGIDRVVSPIADFTAANVERLKSAAACGADAWDPDRYLNIWIARSSSTLGFSTFPGTGPANEQGVAISLDGFSNNPAYVDPSYNMGRTLVHEIGHYLGLYHSWGDENGCNVSDFRQLPGNCQLAGSDIVGGENDNAVGDTPNQGSATLGCPSPGARNDACNATTEGVQYQNFMDYTNDACYSMFTQLQVKRMEQLLLNCRATLLTSLGCVPVARVANDAYLARIANPGPGTCGQSGFSSYCAGETIRPVVELRNTGTGPLTALTLYTRVDSGPVAPFQWTGNLQPFEAVLVTLPGITATGEGEHTLTVYTAQPNNTADGRTANDTLSSRFRVSGTRLLTAVQEGFDGPAFPPTDWRVYNPDSDLTWEHNANAGKEGPGSAYFNDWNNNTRDRFDDLVTPNYRYSNADSVFVHFQLAQAMFSPPGSINVPLDTLTVLLSRDCGNSQTVIYKKWGSELQTVTRSRFADQEFYPRPDDWRRDSINLGLYLGTSESQFQLTFRFSGNFENNIFLDDVNLYTKVLPQALKQKGFLILPTVTTGQFAIWHYQQPTTLRAVEVFTAAGQLVWSGRYSGNADKFIVVNLSGKSAGIYFVRLSYEDAGMNVTQRIVKQ